MFKGEIVGVETIETAVGLAVCKFNDGTYTPKKLLDHMRLRDRTVTSQTFHYGTSQDQACVCKSDYHSSETVKLRKKRRRHERKGFEDMQKEIEGETYSAGDY